MELVNQKEVLTILDISWKKLQEYEKQGKIRCSRISLGTVRYLKGDVLKLQKELKSTQNRGGE